MKSLGLLMLVAAALAVSPAAASGATSVGLDGAQLKITSAPAGKDDLTLSTIRGESSCPEPSFHYTDPDTGGQTVRCYLVLGDVKAVSPCVDYTFQTVADAVLCPNVGVTSGLADTGDLKDLFGEEDFVPQAEYTGTTVRSGEGNDAVFSSYRVFAGPGDDTVGGGDLFGGAGDDDLTPAGKSLGGAGDDRIQLSIYAYTDFADPARGGPGNDQIVGNRYRNLLIGGSGNDKLRGKNDGDVLKGGGGRDFCHGGGNASVIDKYRPDRAKGCERVRGIP